MTSKSRDISRSTRKTTRTAALVAAHRQTKRRAEPVQALDADAVRALAWLERGRPQSEAAPTDQDTAPAFVPASYRRESP
jgi:hypothetical protein